ncbi:MAG: hypothetical protein ACI8P0_001936 [Planctomycetaceae bacterium]
MTCSISLIDAVPLDGEREIVIPPANYTLEALANVEFSLRVERPIERVESVHRGHLNFRNDRDNLTDSHCRSNQQPT